MPISQLEDSWSQHIDAWRISGLSQNAYCRRHDLRPNRFTYWKRKLARSPVDHQPAAVEPSPAFVPLQVSYATGVDKGLRLRLPNGCELSGIDAQHLPVVAQLIEVLR